jgi:hypothetical protein
LFQRAGLSGATERALWYTGSAAPTVFPSIPPSVELVEEEGVDEGSELEAEGKGEDEDDSLFTIDMLLFSSSKDGEPMEGGGRNDVLEVKEEEISVEAKEEDIEEESISIFSDTGGVGVGTGGVAGNER